MMGIYIKGMEKPEHCGYCRFRYDGICHALQKTEYSVEDCPLVPIPPHGQLIDLSTVKLHDGPYEYDDWVEWALEQYQDAPIFAPEDRPKEKSDG